MAACLREAAQETPLRSLFAAALYFSHKNILSPALIALGASGMGCRYPQSCSEYATLSVLKYGIFEGSARALLRICSCNPWMKPSIHLMSLNLKEAAPQ
jgi:putative component of membrane protein insertase Oxa1/YidC/SpoIIIJ protein YidD